VARMGASRTIAIASDHRGYELKRCLRRYLESGNYRVVDLGPHNRRPVDYPDAAVALAQAIQSGPARRGILICGSGVGVTIAANRIPGIRACLCTDVFSAHQGVEHDDMNVLVLAAWVTAEKQAQDLVNAFIHARFDRAPRHVRRLRKVKELEDHGQGAPAAA